MNTGMILLVEDNPGDVRLTREALRESNAPNSLNVAQDGIEAMAYLRRSGTYAGAPRPELVLLDLNLPKKDGLEVLDEIKRDPNLKTIPVVVLTTSANPHDIARSYQLHANSYVTKPSRLEHFLEVVRSLVDFWFRAAELPTEKPPKARTMAAGG